MKRVKDQQLVVEDTDYHFNAVTCDLLKKGYQPIGAVKVAIRKLSKYAETMVYAQTWVLYEEESE